MKQSKNIRANEGKYDKLALFSIDEAIALVQDLKYSSFDESVDLAVNLDVDPRHAEENIRVTTPLPHGTGKLVTVLVLASGPKEKEAIDAGADYVGNKEYLTKIKTTKTRQSNGRMYPSKTCPKILFHTIISNRDKRL